MASGWVGFDRGRRQSPLTRWKVSRSSVEAHPVDPGGKTREGCSMDRETRESKEGGVVEEFTKRTGIKWVKRGWAGRWGPVTVDDNVYFWC